MIETLSFIDTAKKRIVALKGGVSIAELAPLAEATGVETQGSSTWTFKTDSNLIIWAGSPAFIDQLMKLASSSDIEIAPTTALVYAIDGLFLDMPVARRPPKKGYKDPHWLPIVFNLV